jgi:hypothetical protein
MFAQVLSDKARKQNPDSDWCQHHMLRGYERIFTSLQIKAIAQNTYLKLDCVINIAQLI